MLKKSKLNLERVFILKRKRLEFSLLATPEQKKSINVLAIEKKSMKENTLHFLRESTTYYSVGHPAE